MLLSLTLKENTVSNLFYYIHILEIPTNKTSNSYNLILSKIENQSCIMQWSLTSSGLSLQVVLKTGLNVRADIHCVSRSGKQCYRT